MTLLARIRVIALIMLAVQQAPVALAELHDRGGGLIYDDVLDITWLQDAAYHVTTNAPNVDANGKMTWQDAVNWVDTLVYHDPVRNVDWDDWRLPRIMPVDGHTYDLAYSYEGLTDNGYNITNPASELSYMYHVNLKGVSLVSTSGDFQPGNAGIADTSPFTGLSSATWSQNAVPDDTGKIFIVGMGNGHQNWYDKTVAQSPWAVRDGDVAINPDGDLNDDGIVNIGDLLVALRIFHGYTQPTPEQSLNADLAPLVNGSPSPDGMLTAADVLILKRIAHGLTSLQ